MATRPIFIPTNPDLSNNHINIDDLVKTQNVDFTWHTGLTIHDKQQSIASLHDNAKLIDNISKILEISTRSTERLGVALSAFNLKIKSAKGRQFSVESVYQSSKVFNSNQGEIQYLDLLYKSPAEAKTDPRLKTSGNLVAFRTFGKTEKEWSINPISAYYNWIYLNALMQHPEYHEPLLEYHAFTDIEFNPKKSLNCQAYAAALFCSLYKNDLLEETMKTSNNFLSLYHKQNETLDLFG